MSRSPEALLGEFRDEIVAATDVLMECFARLPRLKTRVNRLVASGRFHASVAVAAQGLMLKHLAAICATLRKTLLQFRRQRDALKGAGLLSAADVEHSKAVEATLARAYELAIKIAARMTAKAH